MTQDTETTALFQVIAALSSVSEERRQAIVESAMIWCKGRLAAEKIKVGRPRGSKNKSSENAGEKFLKERADLQEQK